MGEKFKPGCRPPVAQPAQTVDTNDFAEEVTEEVRRKSMIQVGKPAPDFTLNAYHKGEFKQFTLSEFKGKWVLLCFYPGDFTFV